jgi:uncharacterized protein
MRSPLLSILLVAAVTAPAAAQPTFAIPAHDGWVTDGAGMLSDAQERELEAMMESYRQGSTHEIALLTVSELPGVNIERFALEAARKWGLGLEGKNNGALLVVTRAERKVRIEIGRGLEGQLPDSVSGRIIRDVIVPEFKAGRFFGGMRAGVQAIHAAIGGRYADIPDRRGRSRRGRGGWLFLVVMGLMMMFGMISRRGGGGRGLGGRRRGGSIWPWLFAGTLLGSAGRHRSSGFGGGGFGGGGFGGGGFGGGGGFSGGGASGSW